MIIVTSLFFRLDFPSAICCELGFLSGSEQWQRGGQQLDQNLIIRPIVRFREREGDNQNFQEEWRSWVIFINLQGLSIKN